MKKLFIGLCCSALILISGCTSKHLDIFPELSSPDLVNAEIAPEQLHQDIDAFIDGVVERVSPQQSDDYYLSRPRDSQLGAWVSQQSTAIPNREWLSNRCDELTAQYEGKDIPRPPHWGGYRIVPDLFEFWQGQPSRLHDRFRYTIEAGGWNIQRLCP